jgi:hypothetical protein
MGVGGETLTGRKNSKYKAKHIEGINVLCLRLPVMLEYQGQEVA